MSLKSVTMPTVLRTVVASCIAVCLTVSLAACSADMPEGIPDEQTMEEILYDYHLAQALSDNGLPESVSKENDYRISEAYYTKAALAKHGMTNDDFDKALMWYSRHSEKLFDIYKRLNERVAAEAGSSTGGNGGAYAGAASSDTTDIWQGGRSYLLSSTGQNYVAYEQTADTAIHAGDLLTLHFIPSWVYREGRKAAIAQLALVYENDSVAVTMSDVYNDRPKELSISVGKMPLKIVRVFIYQQATWSEKPKLLVLSGVSLVRFRHEVSEKSESTPTDSLSVTPVQPTLVKDENLVRDSLLRADSLKKKAPHFK